MSSHSAKHRLYYAQRDTEAVGRQLMRTPGWLHESFKKKIPSMPMVETDDLAPLTHRTGAQRVDVPTCVM